MPAETKAVLGGLLPTLFPLCSALAEPSPLPDPPHEGAEDTPPPALSAVDSDPGWGWGLGVDDEGEETPLLKSAVRTWDWKESPTERPALERHRDWNVKCWVKRIARDSGKNALGYNTDFHTEEIDVYASG